MKINKSANPLTVIGAHSRQGDVLLMRIAKIPSGLKKVKPTFALGETSGHHHSFEGSGATCFAGEEGALAEFATVQTETPLTHQEHSTHMIPPGNYRKCYQVEDTSKEVTQVTD